MGILKWFGSKDTPPKPASGAASAAQDGKSTSPKGRDTKAEVDPLGLKKSLRDREKAAGLKSGGVVRGTGCATKGKKFSGVK